MDKPSEFRPHIIERIISSIFKIITLLSIPTVVILVALIFPTFVVSIFLGPQSFFSKKIYSADSPGNKFVINVSRKINFPVAQILGPSGTIDVSLVKKQDEKVIDSIEFYIHEFDDLAEPAIIWKNNEVQVEKFTSYQNFAIKFQLPPN